MLNELSKRLRQFAHKSQPKSELYKRGFIHHPPSKRVGNGRLTEIRDNDNTLP